MSAKYKSPSFLLPNELNTSANPATGTGVNSLYSMDFPRASASYIDLGTIDITGSCTISFWINFNSISHTYQKIFFAGTSASDQFSIGFATTNQGVAVNTIFASGQEAAAGTKSLSNNSISINTWYNIVITKTTGVVQNMYLNGVNDTNTPSGFWWGGAPNVTRIGDSGSNALDAKIDEVAIFNRALNSTEIAALYGGTSPNIYPSNLIASNLNPIAYYPLGEQAQMQGYLGNEASSEWQFPNGVLQDYVMDFDSTSPGDYISAPMTMLNSATQCTISFWGKKDVSNKGLVVGSSQSGGGIWIQWYSDGNIYFSPRGAGAGSFSVSYAQPYDNNWHHYLGVYDGSSAANCKLYLDGDLVATGSGTAPPYLPATTGDNFQIGALATSFLSDGQISNVAVWNTAITDSAQIANIYNNGSPQTTYTVTPQNWWKLNATSVYTPSAPNYTTALDFDGASGTYILIGNNNSLSGPYTGYTISAWAKTPVSWEADYNVIFSKKYSFYFGLNSSHYLVLNPGSGTAFASYEVTSTTALSLDTWYHFLVTADGTNVKLYINGSLDKTQATTNTAQYSNTSNTPYISGYSNAGDYDTWKGELSNIGFYNSALTPSQVSTLFNFGTPETNISFSPQAWWKLDDQNAITDSSGNGNTGTNNGATDATTSVAVVPSWKIPTALTIPTINYTTALNFNSASSNYINCGDVLHNDGQTPLTVSGWVKITTAAGHTSSAPLANKKKVRMAPTYIMSGWAVNFATTSAQTNRLHFELIGDTTSATGGISKKALTFSFTDGLWHHVAVTYDGSGDASGVKFYIDGLEDTNTQTLQNTFSGTLANDSTVDFQIGKVPKYGAINYMDGDLSNIQIWNTALTSSQVSTLYNSGQPETAISFSPVSWWKLDTGGSTITDYGSGGNNGTNSTPGATQITSDVFSGVIPVNGVSTTLPSTALQQSDLQFDSPYSNYSLSFDGTGDYIDCTDISYFSGADRFSLSTWFKVTDNPSTNTNRDIISKGSTSSGTTSFFIRKGKNTNLNKINLSLNEGTINVPGTTQLQNNVWYHLTVVYKGYESNNADRAKIYINGVDDTGSYTNTVPTTLVSSTQPLRIGRWASGTDFYGSIDETAIWESALTDAQVLQVYNNGRPSDITSLSPNYWWRLGENAYFNDVPAFTVPNSITGAPNGTGAGSITTMISADAPGTYANGVGTNLDIVDRVGDAALSTANSQSYNMIPSDISPYVPQYVGKQIANNFSMTFDGIDDYFNTSFSGLNGVSQSTISLWLNTSNINQNAHFFGNRVVNNGLSSQFFTDGNTYIHLNNQSFSFNTSTHFSNNTWHNFIIVFDGSLGTSDRLKAYVDGNLITFSSVTSTTLLTSTNNLLLGYAPGGGYFTGSIDEFAIFDTALNAGQIYNDIYQPTATGTNQTADFVNNPNLPNPVAWYRMGD